MGKFTKKETQILEDHVLDCMLQNLSERKALEYISDQITPPGKPRIEISATTYYSIKRRIEADDDKKLALLKREGFIREQYQRINEIKRGQQELWDLWKQADDIEDLEKRLRVKVAIRSQLDEETRLLTQLYDALPFVAAVQTKLNKNMTPEERTLADKAVKETEQKASAQ